MGPHSFLMLISRFCPLRGLWLRLGSGWWAVLGEEPALSLCCVTAIAALHTPGLPTSAQATPMASTPRRERWVIYSLGICRDSHISGLWTSGSETSYVSPSTKISRSHFPADSHHLPPRSPTSSNDADIQNLTWNGLKVNSFQNH